LTASRPAAETPPRMAFRPAVSRSEKPAPSLIEVVEATAPATSSGIWSRARDRAFFDTSRSLVSCTSLSMTPSLRVKPGATPLTRMFEGPSSRAKERVMPRTAPLLAT